MADAKTTFESRLISEVRNHQCIFDRTSVDYKDMTKKSKIWSDIAKRVSKPVDVCKLRWKSLRYKFLTESVKVQAGVETQDSIKWPHYKSLMFLKEHINPRKNPLIENNGFTAEGDFDHEYPEEQFTPIDYPIHMPTEPQISIFEAKFPNYDAKTRLNSSIPVIGQKRRRERNTTVKPSHPRNRSAPPQPETTVITTSNLHTRDLSNKKREDETKKRKRVSRRAQDDKFMNFLDSVGSIFANSSKESLEHEPFLQLLGKKLNRLPGWEQEEMKMEILNRVHHRVSEFERNNPMSRLNGNGMMEQE